MREQETDREFVDRMIEVVQKAWHGFDTLRCEEVEANIKLGDLRRLVLALSLRTDDADNENLCNELERGRGDRRLGPTTRR